MARKLVKPADPAGRIWDPSHKAFLPPGGMEVDLTPYWVGLERGGNVLVEDLPAAVAPAASPIPPGAAPAV